MLAPFAPYQVSEEYLVMKDALGMNKNHRGKWSTIVPKDEIALAKNKKNMCMIAKPSKCLKGVDEKIFQVCLVNTSLLYMLIKILKTLPSIISSLLQGYDDLFPDEMPVRLPPLRGIEYRMILYRVNKFPMIQLIEVTQQKPKSYQGKWKSFLRRG